MGLRLAQELDKDKLEEEDRDSSKILNKKTVIAEENSLIGKVSFGVSAAGG